MSELDDIEALGAEYVLGTLSREERAAVAERRVAEPALDAAIAAWERRLAPLADTVSPLAPPPGLYNKIRAQIGLSAHVVSLKAREQSLVRRANRWRNATLSMSAVAASLVGVVGWQMHLADQVPTQYVAVLQAGKELPAFLLTVDTKANMFVISAMKKPDEPEKSYQLWLVHDDMPQPKSLGVFDDSEMAMRPMAEGKMHDMMMDGTYAVSVEPRGGSPTGQPTGPVVFSGKLVKATP
jgi:anti-sigma-K factor RskA